MPRLAILPLDDRPCTYDQPARVAAIAGAEALLPPRELLGNLTRQGDRAALGAWLAEVGPQVDAVVLALDTLAHGGLVPSRRHEDPLATCVDFLRPLHALREARPELPVHAFAVTMRISNSDVNEEEKAYWDRFGPTIYRWSFLQHRAAAEGQAEDRIAARELAAQIPPEILEDYVETRRRNFLLLESYVKWAGAGAFDTLALTSDDTSPFGLNVQEREELEGMVKASFQQHRVLIYPGADEVATVLTARALHRLAGREPKLAVSWHPLEGKRITAMYEDRPLWQTLRGQIQAAGCKEVGDAATADALLVVNAPKAGQGDLVLGLDLDKPDEGGRSLEPLLATLDEAKAQGQKVGLGDVAYANGMDPKLLPHLGDRLDPEGLLAFSAWNTAGNAFGSLVAATSLAVQPEAQGPATERFLDERLAEDGLYMAQLRGELKAQQAEGASLEALANSLAQHLPELWAQKLPARPRRFLTGFPWARLFEAKVLVADEA